MHRFRRDLQWVGFGLIALALALAPAQASAQERTVIINKTQDSIYYAQALWVRGTVPGGSGSGLAVEPIDSYDITGWYEIKPGGRDTVKWTPYLRIQKNGRSVQLPEASSKERSFPIHIDSEFSLSLDDKPAYTKADVPKKKGYQLSRGFFQYRKGVATVYPDSKTLADEGRVSVDVGTAVQIQGKPKKIVPPQPMPEEAIVAIEINVSILNKTPFDVAFSTIGTSKTPYRIQSKSARQPYSFEIDAAKGGVIEIAQVQGPPKRYTLKADGKFDMVQDENGLIVLKSARAAPMPLGPRKTP